MLLRYSRLQGTRPKFHLGFTLVELLVGMSIFSLLLVVLTGIVNVVYKAWDGSKRTTEMSQDARAILLLVEQDLSAAVVSDLMQMGQNPNLDGKLPPDEAEVVNSDALFWWGPISGTSQAGLMNLSQFGWYLSTKQEPISGKILHNLNRFNRRFDVVDDPVVLLAGADTANNLFWYNQLVPSGPTSMEVNSRAVSSNVIGFWIECLDRHGVAIPPRSNNPGRLRFNSAERFQMAPAGQFLGSNNDKTFIYTADTTVQANMLPSSVRITIMMLDDRSLDRFPGLPSLPAYNETVPVAESIDDYRALLQDKGISPSVFTTTVKLVNSP